MVGIVASLCIALLVIGSGRADFEFTKIPGSFSESSPHVHVSLLENTVLLSAVSQTDATTLYTGISLLDGSTVFQGRSNLELASPAYWNNSVYYLGLVDSQTIDPSVSFGFLAFETLYCSDSACSVQPVLNMINLGRVLFYGREDIRKREWIRVLRARQLYY